jgi:two-component system OmpR family sensor kinase
MRSLRGRLTLAYTVALALVLGLVLIAVGTLLLDALGRHISDNERSSLTAADSIVRQNDTVPLVLVERLVLERASRDGVKIFLLRGDDAHRPAPPQMRLSISTLLGLRTYVIQRIDGAVIIVPDLEYADRIVSAELAWLGVAFGIGLIVSWLIARWLAEQALTPLKAVVGELRRFGAGDFTPHSVAALDKSELGELIEAHNSAAAQVAAALNERRRAEDEMRRFVAEAGHELRTPLTVVIGYLDMLERGGIDDPVVRAQAFRNLSSETTRIRGLVERLVALTKLDRPEATRLVPVDATEIVAGVIERASTRNGGVRILFRSMADVDVLADPDELEQAIGNLVDNALKYGAGTPVEVELRRNGAEVVVRVRDGGPGVLEEERQHIFERFYRGERRGEIEGSGLGLAIVERVAARCGGRVALADGRSGQTTFELRLPALTAPG